MFTSSKYHVGGGRNIRRRGKPRWVRFHRTFVYTCKQSNIMCSRGVWPHGNGLVGFYSLQKLFKLCFFLFPIDNLSAHVLKVYIYRHILVDDIWAVILEICILMFSLLFTVINWIFILVVVVEKLSTVPVQLSVLHIYCIANSKFRITCKQQHAKGLGL